MKRLVLCLVPLIFVAACGNPQNATSPKHQSNLGGTYTTGEIFIEGKPLTCVKLEQGSGNYSTAGLSCDWVAFHAQDVTP